MVPLPLPLAKKLGGALGCVGDGEAMYNEAEDSIPDGRARNREGARKKEAGPGMAAALQHKTQHSAHTGSGARQQQNQWLLG